MSSDVLGVAKEARNIVPQLDLSLSQLLIYRPEVNEAADFDEFWQTTLRDARSRTEPATLRPLASALTEFEIFDMKFPGFGGDPVCAWAILPRRRTPRLATVVEFNAYGGGRGLPHQNLAWPAAGYAYVNVDTRGQGSALGSMGSTPDPQGSGPAVPGFMTRGIASAETYFYRRVFTDAVRAIDAIRDLPWADHERVIVAGASQGGGIALAAAGLVNDLAAVMPEVPFLCHFFHSVTTSAEYPYREVADYLGVHRGSVAETFSTLSYFDGVNFAKRCTVPALFSVGLMDPICLPSSVFAAYNQLRGVKEIAVYPFNGHEGGGPHWDRQAAWLESVLR